MKVSSAYVDRALSQCQNEVFVPCVLYLLPVMVSGGGSLSDLSLCLFHGPDSGQPFLCGHQSSGKTIYISSGALGSGDSVECHTNLTTCCSGSDGIRRGDWYFPDRTRLPTPQGTGIFEARYDQRVDLRRN